MERSTVIGTAVVVAILVVVAGFLAWRLLPSEDDPDDSISGETDPVTETAVSEPTEPVIELTFADYSQVYDPLATANAMNCLMTPYSEPIPHAAQAVPFFPSWMKSDDIWLSSPGDFFEVSHGGSWYGGQTDIAWYSDSGTDSFSATFHHPDDESLDFTVDERHLRNIGPALEVLISTIDIPAPGCWEIEATVGGAEATFVVNVLPFEERPDRQFAIDLRRAVAVYPPPATCPVTPWTGPESRSDTGLIYWIDGDGISLADTFTVYWSGEQTHLAFYTDEEAEFAVTGRTHESDDQPLDLFLNFNLVSEVNRFDTAWQALTTFPAPGCWDIHAEAGDSTFDATIYVYPEACRMDFQMLGHEIEAGGPVTIPDGCQIVASS